MIIDKPILIDFHRKSISIELTTFFFIDSYRVVSEIDINLRLISIAIDCYRLSVYRLTTLGCLEADQLIHDMSKFS